MIYFLINNNYHWYDVKLHLPALKEAEMEVGLIQIPHTLETIAFHEAIHKIHLFPSPFIGRNNFWNPFGIFKTHKLIKSKLNLTKNDILLVYTEEEFLNQFVLMQFKKADAKVFLLDEGWQSILTYTELNYSGYSLKWKMKLFYLKYIIGYKTLRLNFLNNYIYPQVDDEYIDGMLCFRYFKMARKIKQTAVSRDVKVISNLDGNKVIFLSQPLYDIYVSFEEYVQIVNTVVKGLSSQFETVYFKFHPREKDTEDLQDYISNNYTNIVFIKEKVAIEEIISCYKPKYAVSFQSVSLLNLTDMGIVPIYCYRDFDNLSKCADFIVIDKALIAMDYHFPENISDIISSPCGFNIQKSQDISLANFFTKESHLADK